MRRALREFSFAVEFLTLVRLRASGSYDPSVVGGSLAWFPVVGLWIGLFLLLVDRAGSWLFGPAVGVGLVLLTNAVISGGLHLDGLADSADGLFGGQSREQRLEIMRDSRTGSFGAIAVVLAQLLAYAALLSMTEAVRAAALASAPVLSRFAMVTAIAAFPYARPSGLGRTFKDHLPRYVLPVAATVAVALAALAMGVAALVFTGTALAVALLAGWFAYRRLGGLTGDIYGAIGVLAELVMLLLAATDTQHPWLSRWLAW